MTDFVNQCLSCVHRVLLYDEPSYDFEHDCDTVNQVYGCSLNENPDLPYFVCKYKAKFSNDIFKDSD